MVRFLADASLHHAIVTGCLRREPVIDFVSARAAKLDGLSDLDVLALAAAQGRILVTHDVRTMPRHFAAFLATGATSPGVFLVKQRAPIASVIEDLVLISRASMPESGRTESLSFRFNESADCPPSGITRRCNSSSIAAST